MSPGCINNFDQFIVSPSSLGGVPVLSRPTLKGMLRNLVAKILLGGSPILPPGFFSFFVWILWILRLKTVSKRILDVLELSERFFASFS